MALVPSRSPVPLRSFTEEPVLTVSHSSVYFGLVGEVNLLRGLCPWFLEAQVARCEVPWGVQEEPGAPDGTVCEVGDAQLKRA